MKLAIIGGGPAGVMAAIIAKENNPLLDITIFDKAKPLVTLLCTGGGRCNLTNAEFDFKELAKNYPRGEKFLYSVFSQFDVSSMFEFFSKYGLELYIQDDNRVFPKSDQASEIKDLLIGIAVGKGIKIKSYTEVFSLKKEQNFIINENFSFDKVVIATGGRNKFGYKIAESLGHTVSDLEPVLCGMKTKEPFAEIAGVSLKNVLGKVKNIELQGDLLFTHKGLSGPLILNFSSHLAFEKMPISLSLNFSGLDFEEQDLELIKLLAENPKKNISNLLQKYLPSALIDELLKKSGIPLEKKSFEINSKDRKCIAGFLSELKVDLIAKDTPYMVTAGGIELNEVDKNLQSKKVEGLYFAGEILNIDGLCGGYNLQACFSMGYVIGKSVSSNKN